MSLIKSIMHQLGLSGDPAKNFTLSVPAAPDGTMKLARGNAGATTQDIMTVDAAGSVTMRGLSLDDGTAGGGDLTLKSLGFLPWYVDNANGGFRVAGGNPYASALTIDAAGKVAFPAMAQSLTGNGYIKLPGGLIIQWGLTGGSGQRAVTFPIPFPNGVFRVLASVSSDAVIETTQYSATTSFISLSGCRVTPQFDNNGTIGIAAEQAAWIAIGH